VKATAQERECHRVGMPTQDTRHKTQDTRHKTQGTRHKPQATRHKTPTRHKTQDKRQTTDFVRASSGRDVVNSTPIFGKLVSFQTHCAPMKTTPKNEVRK
jgi:hypothetical protein